jgi:Flp pilus assembly protein TadG
MQVQVAFRRRQRERGSAMMEMAFVLPVYFGLVWGILQFCFVFLGYNSLTYGCTVAANYAALHGSSSSNPCDNSACVSSVACAYFWGAPKNATITVTASSGWPPDPGDTITVRASYVYSIAIPFSKLSQIIVGTSATAVVLE